jgi:hypothetical protein
LFDEGSEAFFFDSDAEFVDVLRRLMAEPALVSRVADAGLRRVSSGANTYADRASQIISHIAD